MCVVVVMMKETGLIVPLVLGGWLLYERRWRDALWFLPAVLALGAFTLAYSEFMMATVIIPDPRMWTIMVWLFQLQTFAHPSVVYASLVIAAIPTLLIFLLAQNLIMRGLVVPVE